MLPASDPQPPVQPPPARRQPPPTAARLIALLEVLICSDFPTQLALASAFHAIGYSAFGSTGRLQIAFVVGISLIDSLLLVGLILFFLHAHGESPREILFGTRPIAGEIAHGIPLIVVALVAGIGILLAIQQFIPSLHSVRENPLEGLLTSPRDAWLFALVVLVAGGVREEIQRAFLLHRFDVFLGGARVGLVVTSAAFGAGHLLQGYDAAIVTGLLGASWGVIYLRRRSVVAPMVSHAGFDLLQIAQYVVTRR